MKGGYTIIDLQDKNLVIGGSAVTIDGVYNAIEGSYRKAILLEGITIGGVEKPARFVVFGADDGAFKAAISVSATADVLVLTVTDEDSVSIANA